MADPKTPELPQDPGPDIQRMMDATKTTPEDPSINVRTEIDKYLDLLPPSLRLSILEHARDTARSIFTQHAQVDGSIKVNEAEEGFYRGRFRDIHDSGYLNPHINPAREIK